MPNPVIIRRLYTPKNLATLVTNGLFAHYFSSDFDGSTNGSTVGEWFSQEHPGPAAQQDAFQSGVGGNLPAVDGTKTCSGHKTLRFDGKSNLGCANASGDSNGVYSKTTSNYPTGIEYFMVFQADNNTATGAALGFNALGTPCFDENSAGTPILNSNGNFDLFPFQNNQVRSGFGVSSNAFVTRPIGSFAGGWHCINVSTPNPAGTRTMWLDSEAFNTLSGYTFFTTSFATGSIGSISSVGGAANGTGGAAVFYGLIGNVAAMFYYNRVLSVAERTQMRAYLKANWGCTSF